MKISTIRTFPIKSAREINHSHCFVSEKGLSNDRIFLLTDKDFNFLTLRDFPVLTKIRIEKLDNKLILNKFPEGDDALNISFDIPEERIRKNVKIWKHHVDAIIMNDEINSWFSDYLNTTCYLVRTYQNSKREKSIQVKPYKTNLNFSDAYPLLFISQASLEDLNNRLDEPVSMERFRPNIVIDNCPPYEEDLLTDFQIGSAQFRKVKKCARCVVTTIDPNTGERGIEPLHTLSMYRKEGRVINFGMYAICTQEGTVSIGDELIRL